MQNFRALTAALLLSLSYSNSPAEQNIASSETELAEITVMADRVANDAPASTYASPATALRFDPLTELQ